MDSLGLSVAHNKHRATQAEWNRGVGKEYEVLTRLQWEYTCFLWEIRNSRLIGADMESIQDWGYSVYTQGALYMPVCSDIL